VLVLLAISLVVLVVSGVYLWFRYEPTAAAAWPTVRSLDQAPTWSSRMRTTHRVASFLTIALALAAAILLVGRRIDTGRRGAVAGVGVLVTALAASFTGYLLPWDQLALWAVTVGSNMRGVQATFDTRVKYLLLGSREISLGTYRFWAISHLVLGALVAAAVVLAWLRTRERRVSPSSPAEEPAPEPVG
jgi:quinol-cytochrome oxidoreductase complex cytochrome b subunit